MRSMTFDDFDINRYIAGELREAYHMGQRCIIDKLKYMLTNYPDDVRRMVIDLVYEKDENDNYTY